MYSSSGEAQTFLHDEQRLVLRQSFEEEPYPSQDTLKSLCEMIGESERKVIMWFGNQRKKEREKKIKISTESKYINNTW